MDQIEWIKAEVQPKNTFMEIGTKGINALCVHQMPCSGDIIAVLHSVIFRVLLTCPLPSACVWQHWSPEIA